MINACPHKSEHWCVYPLAKNAAKATIFLLLWVFHLCQSNKFYWQICKLFSLPHHVIVGTYNCVFVFTFTAKNFKHTLTLCEYLRHPSVTMESEVSTILKYENTFGSIIGKSVETLTSCNIAKRVFFKLESESSSFITFATCKVVIAPKINTRSHPHIKICRIINCSLELRMILKTCLGSDGFELRKYS